MFQSGFRERKVACRGAVGFFDEPMEQYPGVPANGEQNTGNSSLKMDTNFPKLLVHFAHQGHTQLPSELHGFDVFADSFPLDGRQRFQPVSYWLIARLRFEKGNKKNRMSLASRDAIVLNLVRLCKQEMSANTGR